ncbi:hypothetical protein IQ07DRAFT_32565 [Pyrenochaeta sp. DS3sAY3a]|nr:hypothetical protein IQ07DRAFT_32565 [Pyrenochaeta sp. DS3sAY3a]
MSWSTFLLMLLTLCVFGVHVLHRRLSKLPSISHNMCLLLLGFLPWDEIRVRMFSFFSLLLRGVVGVCSAVSVRRTSGSYEARRCVSMYAGCLSRGRHVLRSLARLSQASLDNAVSYCKLPCS